MTSSNGNIFRVTGPLCGEFTGPGEFPTQRPVTRSFDVYFDLRLNKRLCKQSRGWWFETLLCPLWRHSNVWALPQWRHLFPCIGLCIVLSSASLCEWNISFNISWMIHEVWYNRIWNISGSRLVQKHPYIPNKVESELHWLHTVYPKKYAHGFVVLCFVVVMQSFIMNSHEVFIHIHQGCFAGTGAIVRLPQCQWSKPDGYGKISQCITTTKHSKAKTVCIFLGIYCICYAQYLLNNAIFHWSQIKF